MPTKPIARQRSVLVVPLVLLGILAACATAQAPGTPETAPPAPARPGPGALCPTDLPGVDVTAVDIEGGVALVFTGPAGSRDEIREFARRLATGYVRHQEMMERRGRGRMGPGMRGRPDRPMRGMGRMMLPARVMVRDRADGAEILLLAEKPEEVAALRARERWHVERMRLRDCPMMWMWQESEEADQAP
jgi:hypothetical protein